MQHHHGRRVLIREFAEVNAEFCGAKLELQRSGVGILGMGHGNE